MDTSTIPRFADLLAVHVRELQVSLTALCSSISADLSVPYPLSKRLGIDKNLTWKAARILQAEDAAEALKHIPGKSGLDLFLDAFRRAGAPLAKVEAVAQAVHSLELLVQSHTDDKDTLELVLDGIPSPKRELLGTSRRLAFRGNSGIWGVQARTRLTTTLLAPSQIEPGTVDLVLLAGFLRFRRLRERTSWPILKLRRIGAEGQSIAPSKSEPLDPAGVLEFGPSLMTGFSSSPRPPIQVQKNKDSIVLELPAGPIGNPGAIDLIFGERYRAFAPSWAQAPGDFGEHQSDIDVPVENLLFDLLVHKDLPMARSPRFELLSRLGRSLAPAGPGRRKDALPITEEIVSLRPTVRDLQTDLMPRYVELLGTVAERCQWNLDDFRALRVTMKYPPTPTTAVFSYPLPERS